MPEQQDQQPNPIGSGGFRGVNLNLSPERLPEGDYQLADNMWVLGGEMSLREGLRGMFADKLDGAIYALTAYAVEDDSTPPNVSTWLMFVCGGKLYAAQAGRSRPPFEIKKGGSAGASFAFNGPTVQMRRVGAWMYIQDGRVPLTKVQIPNSNPHIEYRAEEYEGLTAPTNGFSVGLTNEVIDAADDASLWSSFPALSTTSELITNPTFKQGSTHAEDPPPYGWQNLGDSMDFAPLSGSDEYAYFDPGNGDSYVDWPVPSPTYATTLQTYTDLELVAGQGGLVVKSAAHPFYVRDEGAVLKLRSGVNFTPGPYRIVSVDDHNQATLSASAGTAGATGGVGEMVDNRSNTVRNARVFVVKSQNAVAVTNSPGQYTLAILPDDSSEISLVAPIDITDLEITAAGGGQTTVRSTQHSFVAADAGKTVTVTDGVNFTAGGYTILSVNTGVTPHTATLQGVAGTAGATGGTATLSLDAEDTTKWGSGNQGLLTPPSLVTGSTRSVTHKVTSSAWNTVTDVLSLTGVTRDFDETRLRVLGPASNGHIGVTHLSLIPVDVRLNVSRASNGALHLAANDPLGQGANCLGGCWIKRDYRGAMVEITDLQIVGAAQVSSAGHPFTPDHVGLSLDVYGGVGFTVSAPTIVSVVGGIATLSVAIGAVGATGGKATLMHTADFSQSATISVRYSAPATTGQVPFRFGFLQPGQPLSAITWSNPATYTQDGSAFYCDISTIESSVLSQVAYLFIQIIEDLSTDIQPGDLCTIGPISTSGNLTLSVLYGGWGGDYGYQSTELNAANDSVDFIDVVESDPTPSSTPPMQPNGVSNQVAGVLPAPVNDATTHMAIYRTGGVFDDGLGRLIGIVDLASDTVSMNVGDIRWDHTTRRFVDNTPDAALETNEPVFLLSGRTPAPPGAQCLVEWQGHIGLGDRSLVRLSWAIPAGQNTGLYFNTVNVPDPNDIAQSVKGGLWDTGQDNDDIQALVPLVSYLIVLKQRSIYQLIGVDAGSFTLLPHIIRGGTGLTAPNAWAVVGRLLWFLGPDGVKQYNGGDVLDAMSNDIEPALNPSCRGLQKLDPRAYRASFMIWHGLRLYLVVPGSPSDSVPSVIWVWDTRTGGWVGRWTSFAWGAGLEMTSAASLTQDSDADDLYWACRDGQIYHMTGTGDTETAPDEQLGVPAGGLGLWPILGLNTGAQPEVGGVSVAGLGLWPILALNTGTTVQPVPFKWTSRAFGQERMGDEFWSYKTVAHARLNVQAAQVMTYTITVQAAACPVVFRRSRVLAGMQEMPWLGVDAQINGPNAWVSVEGAASTPFRIKSAALVMAKGSPGVV